MAANSDEYQQIAENKRFQKRVQIYVHKAAHAIMSEGGAVPAHTERVALANEILAGNANYRLWAYSCMTNSTLQTAASVSDNLHGIADGDLENTVNSLVNAFAGYATT